MRDKGKVKRDANGLFSLLLLLPIIYFWNKNELSAQNFIRLLFINNKNHNYIIK